MAVGVGVPPAAAERPGRLGPGPLRVRTVARSVGGGAVDETCDVWDSTGRLVAVGHQLAAVRLA